jgi:hypothetical protein
VGILFVLVLLACPALVAAGIGAAGIGMLAQRGLGRRPYSAVEKRTVRRAALVPFGALFWLGVVFIAHGYVNVVYFDRDVGLGDFSEVPLVNGYSLASIDDRSYIALHRDIDRTIVGSVTALQVAGPLIFAKTDEVASAQYPSSTPDAIVDTTTGGITNLGSDTALRDAARASGVALDLQPVDVVFWKRQFTWFDALTALVALTPPALVLAAFARSIRRQRRARDGATLSVP